MQILQHTPEWLEAKKSKIGGSEIFTLCHYYCAKELELLGVDLAKEQPFKTALELFIKIKFGAEDNDIGQVNSVFGKGMERYAANRLSSEIGIISVENSDDFIINDNLHQLAVCSPDGYAEIINGNKLPDYDKTCLIDRNWGNGMLELKTTPYEFNFEAEAGCKWSYIFQLQYNMLVSGLKWGILAAIAPKERETDTDFIKGEVLKDLEWLDKYLLSTEKIDQLYNLYHYVYPKIPALEAIILKALTAFQNALDSDIYPTASSNPTKIQRERKVIALAFPEHYGKLEADEQLDNLINQRMIANTEAKKAEAEAKELEIEIVKKAHSYLQIVGTNFKAAWDKRGSLRFSKV